MENLKKAAVRVAMRSIGSIEYLLNLPIDHFMELVEDIIAADEETQRAREQIKRAGSK